MSKTVLILRHAKSSWSQPGLSDHARPLNARGEADAPAMGSLVRRQELVPDLILSSSARRARSTAEAVAQAAGYDAAIEITDSFYHGGVDAYLEALGRLPDELDRVMVVGHNPTLEELVEQLTGRGEAMPTAALAQVELPINRWGELNEATVGRLVNLWLRRRDG
jgi:phosphohistidine phosphatase